MCIRDRLSVTLRELQTISATQQPLYLTTKQAASLGMQELARKLQCFDRQQQISYRVLKISRLHVAFFSKMEFLAPNCPFLDETFLTRFSDSFRQPKIAPPPANFLPRSHCTKPKHYNGSFVVLEVVLHCSAVLFVVKKFFHVGPSRSLAKVWCKYWTSSAVVVVGHIVRPWAEVLFQWIDCFFWILISNSVHFLLPLLLTS